MPSTSTRSRYVMPVFSAATATATAAAAAGRLQQLQRQHFALPQPPNFHVPSVAGDTDSSSPHSRAAFPDRASSSASTASAFVLPRTSPQSPSTSSPSSSSSSIANGKGAIRLRSDIYTCWRAVLPDGRRELCLHASQARVFSPRACPTPIPSANGGQSDANASANRSAAESGGASSYRRPFGAGQTATRSSSSSSAKAPQSHAHRIERREPPPPLPAMVHTTRHHDYDHDEDYVPSDAENKESKKVEVVSSQPSSPSRSPEPRKRRLSDKKKKMAAPTRYDRVPTLLRFPLLVIGNGLLSWLLYTSLMPFTAYDLGTVSRSVTASSELYLLLLLKPLELAVGWFGHFDGYDLAALTLLTHTPYLFLLGSLYSISLSTLAVALLTDVVAVLLPTQLLRPLSASHDGEAPPRLLANRSIVSDLPVQAYTSMLGSSVYALVLSLAFWLGLPAYLVGQFDYITSLELVHSPYVLPILVLAFLPLGFAAKIFIFTPSTAAKRDTKDARNEVFDPETATLGETVLYNVWGFNHRTRIAIIRTALLAAVTGYHTLVHVVAHVAGTTLSGAVAYSAVWSAASAAAGYFLWWVADVSEVRDY